MHCLLTEPAGDMESLLLPHEVSSTRETFPHLKGSICLWERELLSHISPLTLEPQLPNKGVLDVQGRRVCAWSPAMVPGGN